MAYYEVHCADCKRELGEEFQEVNTWLDEYFKDFGPDHRPLRHHDVAIEKVREKWGDRAAQAAEIHIKRDSHGKIPKFEEEFLYAVMKDKVFDALIKEYDGNQRLAKVIEKFTKKS